MSKPSGDFTPEVQTPAYYDGSQSFPESKSQAPQVKPDPSKAIPCNMPREWGKEIDDAKNLQRERERRLAAAKAAQAERASAVVAPSSNVSSAAAQGAKDGVQARGGAGR